MKNIFTKIIFMLVAVSLCLSFFACASRYRIDAEDKNWALVMISRKDDGEIVYCSAEFKSIYPDAEILDLGCRAKGGKLVVTDNKMQMQYFGSYTEDTLESKSARYDISFNSDEGTVTGYATVTGAKLYDDTLEYSLVIVIGKYTLYFKSIE